eukprot:tig00000498_g1672.t2
MPAAGGGKVENPVAIPSKNEHGKPHAKPEQPRKEEKPPEPAGGSSEQVGASTGAAAAPGQDAPPVPEGPEPENGILVLAYNRPHFLRRTLDSLLQLAGIERFRIHVSQDGHHDGVASAAKEYVQKARINHMQKDRADGHKAGHEHIAIHYKHALDRLFKEFKHKRVIIVEDDMIFSPDFLPYFEQTGRLLDEDPTIWCISSWNDNGFKHLVSDNKRLFRTSYFPGLGWMLRRELWEELSPIFPKQHWDHWMRLSTTNKGRDCVVPEISRNYNIGNQGENMQQHEYEKYLQDIEWNQEAEVDLGDLSYLHARAYEKHVAGLVQQAEAIRHPHEVEKAAGREDKTVFVIPYLREQYRPLSEVFKIWPVPRAYFRNTAIITYKSKTFLLADARRSPFLHDSLKVHRNAAMLPTKSERGQSCDTACSGKHMKCQKDHFDFLNDCAELQKHFGCEGGCGMEIGSDIPCMVSDPADKNYRRCVVTESVSECGASHPITSRLCPCVPDTAALAAKEPAASEKHAAAEKEKEDEKKGKGEAEAPAAEAEASKTEILHSTALR